MALSKQGKFVQDCRIVLVGKTGVGKSSVGNSLLSVTDNKKKFKSSCTGESVTFSCKRLQGNITSRRLGMSVIDTPGLFDTKTPNNEIVTEIMKCIALAAPGPHIFLFVLSVRRYTEEEKNSFKILKELFGEDVKKHTIVVFTSSDQFDDDDDDNDEDEDEKKEDPPMESVDDFIRSSPLDVRSFVTDCGNRYVGICNKRKNPKHQRDVDQLVNMIIKTMDDNVKDFYKQKTFQKAEEVIDQELTSRINKIEAHQKTFQKKEETDPEVSNRITKMETHQKTKDEVKVDKTTRKMAETKVDSKEEEKNIPQTHQKAEVADEDVWAMKQKIRSEILDEIESKTESSPKTGFWGTLTSSLYDGISTVLSVPASYLSGWWS